MMIFALLIIVIFGGAAYFFIDISKGARFERVDSDESN